MRTLIFLLFSIPMFAQCEKIEQFEQIGKKEREAKIQEMEVRIETMTKDEAVLVSKLTELRKRKKELKKAVKRLK